MIFIKRNGKTCGAVGTQFELRRKIMQIPRAGETRILAESFGRALHERDFFYPDGTGGERKAVFSLWNYRKGSPSIIFPVTRDGHVVAVRQYRNGRADSENPIAIETPGGVPQGTRSHEEVAASELLSESGYQAKKIIRLDHKIWIDGAAHNLQFVPLVGIGCVKVADPAPERNEVMETMLIPRVDWFQKIRSGEIDEGRIVALSLLALPFIGGRIEFNP